jgi:hypothetical protein
MKSRLLPVFLTLVFAFASACSIFQSNTEETKEGTEISGVVKPAEEKVKSEPIDAQGNKIDLAMKKKVLVLPFLNRAQFGGDALPKLLHNDIQATLSHFPDLAVVAAQDLPGAEQFTTDYGEYQIKTIYEKARANGIGALVMGSIDEIAVVDEGDEIGILRSRYRTITATIKFQLMDVRSERPLFTKVAQADVTDQTTQLFEGRDPASVDAARAHSAVKKAADIALAEFPQYTKRINWNGRIAKVDVHRYYINAGETSGVLKGQLLKVFGEGEPVVDQETGDTIGFTPGRFKGTLRIVDFFAPDGAVAILHTGAGFREKDRVEVMPEP